MESKIKIELRDPILVALDVPLSFPSIIFAVVFKKKKYKMGKSYIHLVTVGTQLRSSRGDVKLLQ